jgi:hypothetical protein
LEFPSHEKNAPKKPPVPTTVAGDNSDVEEAVVRVRNQPAPVPGAEILKGYEAARDHGDSGQSERGKPPVTDIMKAPRKSLEMARKPVSSERQSPKSKRQPARRK